ncbi:hypothetical protein ACC685_38525, partial [Rhizobium ruizarguesonis]
HLRHSGRQTVCETCPLWVFRLHRGTTIAGGIGFSVERDIEICRRITTTRTVREIYNQSQAERSTLKPIPPAIVVPR